MLAVDCFWLLWHGAMENGPDCVNWQLQKNKWYRGRLKKRNKHSLLSVHCGYKEIYSDCHIWSAFKLSSSRQHVPPHLQNETLECPLCQQPHPSSTLCFCECYSVTLDIFFSVYIFGVFLSVCVMLVTLTWHTHLSSKKITEKPMTLKCDGLFAEATVNVFTQTDEVLRQSSVYFIFVLIQKLFSWQSKDNVEHILFCIIAEMCLRATF